MINTTLYGGGTQCLPLRFFVSGAFQSDLRDLKCWHNSYMILRINFMKKNSNFFPNFFQIFSVFWTSFTNKKVCCTFGPKITYFYILGGHHVHLTPQKMSFRYLFYKVSLKCPHVSTLTSWNP